MSFARLMEPATMSFPLENARLCMDCDTVFDGPLCPSCSSESYFPLSRWIRPALDEIRPRPRKVAETVSKTAHHASLLLAGTSLAYALWKTFTSTGRKEAPAKSDPARRGSPDKPAS